MFVIVPVSLLGQSGLSQTAPAQTEPGQNTPVQNTPSQTGAAAAAILHTQGGVWVNGYEATDSSAVFSGDLVETKPGSPANLTLEGATVLIQPESVARLQTNFLELDHGGVSVGTSKSFKVKVNCITVIPVVNEWTQYEVSNVNGNVQVAARKNDVNVEREADRKKPLPATEASHGATVREGEQKSFDLSQLCGAPAPIQGAGTGLNPKWIAAGVGGAGVLICVFVCHGSGGKTPISSSSP